MGVRGVLAALTVAVFASLTPLLPQLLASWHDSAGVPSPALHTTKQWHRSSAVDPCRHVPVDADREHPRPAEDMDLLLVTGAAGFIGSHLTEQLLALGYRVRAFDNLETGNLLFLNLTHPRLEFQKGDILDLSALRRAMAGVVGVFHLAAASKVLPSLRDPNMATFNIRRNALGTSQVLEVANETGQVRKVIYAASSTYYGNQAVPYEESAPFVPTSPYAASKYMGELQMWTNDVLYGLPTLCLRMFMVYGPRSPSDGAYAVVTGRFLKRLKEGLPLLIEGTGENYRDFIHVEDAARGLIMGFQSAARGISINLGSGETRSVKEVADMVSTLQEHVPARPNDLVGTLANTCRARELLNFRTHRDFVATTRSMMDDAEQGRDAYTAPMWDDPRAVRILTEAFPRWPSMSLLERGEQIRQKLDEDPRFLESFLGQLRSGQ